MPLGGGPKTPITLKRGHDSRERRHSRTAEGPTLNTRRASRSTSAVFLSRDGIRPFPIGFTRTSCRYDLYACFSYCCLYCRLNRRKKTIHMFSPANDGLFRPLGKNFQLPSINFDLYIPISIRPKHISREPGKPREGLRRRMPISIFSDL